MEEALGDTGIDLADIHAVAVSHLHSDHAGGLKHFAGRVPVHIQRAESNVVLSRCRSPATRPIITGRTRQRGSPSHPAAAMAGRYCAVVYCAVADKPAASRSRSGK